MDKSMVKAGDSPKQRIIDSFFDAGQGHIFRWWEELSPGEREELLDQIAGVDLAQLEELTEEYRKSQTAAPSAGMEIKPAPVIPLPSTEEQAAEHEKMKKAGEEEFRKGTVACFVVAGGQSTRLGYDLPKGTYGVGPVTGKSLFQYHAEKIIASSRKYGSDIPWYIMTSRYNSAATKDFFTKHNYFGMQEKDVFFMEQGMLPSIDFDGKLMLDSKNRIAMNPDGHGGVIKALKQSGALDDMAKRGIKYISYFQVDNVLVGVTDPVFIGYHASAGADMSAKVCAKRNPEEKVGIIVEMGGKTGVVEYSDLSKEDMYAKNPDGSLKYSAGSIAIHVFSVDFLERLTGRKNILPFHIAKKKIKYLDEKGNPVVPEKPSGVKFETFIFDTLMESEKTVVIETKREEDFSPLKNKAGEDSPETVRRDLLKLYAGWLEAAGVQVPREPDGSIRGDIEISPLYALDRDDFVKKAGKAGIKFEGKLNLQ